MRREQEDTVSLMIAFLVGDLQQKFIVHMEFACKHSEVLKAAFEGAFIDGKTGVHNLKDVDPTTFRLFAEYLYSGKITLRYHNVDPTDDHGDEANHSVDCMAQDLALVQLLCAGMLSECWDYVYDNTSPESPLCALVAEQCTWSAAIDYSEMQRAPQDLFSDMIQVYRKALPDRIRQNNSGAIQSKDYFVS
ncbi:hypothetical protein BKA65DRAFT_472270 [Rhexocercosporidium sp. MPI-PUGE-AT-0058]|nr:hypothetical protein BKA65DRAFT_472270 [Rhexocercosporidium sp. MPI-PUGE-AT-0058]